MTKLYQFRPFWGLPNASPFCMKAETYLRYRKISFEAVASNPRQSPSKQIPFVITDDGVTISDSEQIISHFEALQTEAMDADLSNEQKAIAYLIRHKVEEELYWQITYMRWGDPQGWAVFLPDLKQHMAGIKGKFLPWLIRRMLLKQMSQRGMKPDNTATSYAAGLELINVLSHLLDDKPYFLDHKIHTVDMSIYAFLANIIDQPHTNTLQNHAKSKANLVAYCQRIKTLIWKDWQAP
ncbi:MAG: glutathione S-transferase family protein [Thiotrichaceae bacterium]|nr:glutathione S-transferase family protein [Thiotrichaceae bacterium]